MAPSATSIGSVRCGAAAGRSAGRAPRGGPSSRAVEVALGRLAERVGVPAGGGAGRRRQRAAARHAQRRAAGRGPSITARSVPIGAARLPAGCHDAGVVGTGASSLWAATMPVDERVEGAPLAGDADVDVAIVGGGFTGLWTALALAAADPRCASPCSSATTSGSARAAATAAGARRCSPRASHGYAAAHGRSAAIAPQRAMHATVDEVGRFAAGAAIDAGWHKGGTVTLARTAAQVRAPDGRASTRPGRSGSATTTCAG